MKEINIKNNDILPHFIQFKKGFLRKAFIEHLQWVGSVL